MGKSIPSAGFTLVELAIVLVVIGLIIGGVLVGRDLIATSEIRAQISQIESYQAAVKAFDLKYNCLPGDCVEGASFGFKTRGIYPGEGDGNRLLEGIFNHAAANNYGTIQGEGETAVFWSDLARAKFIPGSYEWMSSAVTLSVTVTENSNPNLANFLPRAKLGLNNYVYAWSANNTNFYSVSAAYQLQGWTTRSDPGITVQQAAAIDSKIDDGLPLSGRVKPRYLAFNLYFAPACITYAQGAGIKGVSTTAASAGSATTCYDNGNVGGVTQTYSLSQNGGSGINCALSFQFQ